jgi:hypothetical protein
MSFLTVAEFNSDSYFGGFGTGSWPTGMIQMGLDWGEGEAENVLLNSVTQAQATEEYPWSYHSPLQLKKKRVLSISGVVTKHSFDCDNGWSTGTSACAAILNSLHGIIQPLECGTAFACSPHGTWSGCWCLARVEITYTHGFTSAEQANVKIGGAVKTAIGLFALYYLQNIGHQGAIGNSEISSFSSAGYSESRVVPFISGAQGASNRPSMLVSEAIETLRRLNPKRVLAIRGKRGW